MDRTLKLKVPVPDRFVAEVQVGEKAKVSTAAYDCTFEGAITRINPSVDPATRTFEVEIQLPNTNGALKSGSFAKAAIETRFDTGRARPFLWNRSSASRGLRRSLSSKTTTRGR